jgi:hypothetical protein
MASNLLGTTTGVNAMVTAQRHLLERRLSRFFKRNLVIDYNQWKSGGGFTLETLLGELNGHHDEEIIDLYRLLALVGGTPYTVADMLIYVDPINGSDESGDGTVDHPFESLWFIGTLPKRINHTVDIMFLSDVSVPNYQELTLDYEFGPDGYLNFIGVGAPTVVEGPLTVSTTGAVGSGAGMYVKMTSAIGAVHAGEFLMATSGGNSGQAQPIHSRFSSDTFLLIAGSFPALAPGDTMNVVRPSVKFSCRALTLACRNGSWYSNIVRDNGRISFSNLVIDIANSNDARNALLIDNTCPACFGFVQLDPPDDGTWKVKSGVNVQSPTGSAESRSSSGVTNIADFGTESSQHFAGMAIKDTGKNFPGIVEQGCIQWWCTRGLITLKKESKMNHVSCERIESYLAVSEIFSTMVEGRANAGAGGGLESYNSLHDIDGLIVLNSDNVIALISQSTITLQKAERDGTYSTISAYGIYFQSSAFLELRDAGANLTGALGDIRFDCVSPGVTSTIPAAYGWTNQQAAVVKRLSV